MSEVATTQATPAEQVQESVPAGNSVNNPQAQGASAASEVSNSTKILELARKEAASRKGELEHKTQLAKVQEELTGLRKEREELQSLQKTYRDNPEALLKKLGIEYDELTEAIVQYYDKEEKAKAPVTAEDIRKQVEAEFARKAQMEQEELLNGAVDEFRREVDNYVKTNGSQYPYIDKLHNSMGGANSPQELLYNIVEEHLNATGQLISLDDAAKNAEEYFRDEWNNLNSVLNNKEVVKGEAGTTVASSTTTISTPPKGSVSPMYEAKLPRQADQLPLSQVGHQAFKRIDSDERSPLKLSNAVEIKKNMDYDISNRQSAISRAVEALNNSLSKKV